MGARRGGSRGSFSLGGLGSGVGVMRVGSPLFPVWGLGAHATGGGLVRGGVVVRGLALLERGAGLRCWCVGGVLGVGLLVLAVTSGRGWARCRVAGFRGCGCGGSAWLVPWRRVGVW